MLIAQCTSNNSTKVTVTPSQSQPPISYTVKLINQVKKSEYTVEKLVTTTQFSSLDGLKQQLRQLNPHVKDSFGYITPGHGLKGKLNSIITEQDLVEVYAVYKNKRNVLLWCYVGTDSAEDPKQYKRPATSTASKHTPAAKRTTCQSTINAVQQLVEELKEKHGSKYTVERLNAWAHMINMGKHSSKDDPPDLPFFGKKKTNPVEITSMTPSTSVQADSPSKRVGVRTQCIDQLTKWHKLLKNSAISQSQYEELKGTILKDMSMDPRKE